MRRLMIALIVTAAAGALVGGVAVAQNAGKADKAVKPAKTAKAPGKALGLGAAALTDAQKAKAVEILDGAKAQVSDATTLRDLARILRQAVRNIRTEVLTPDQLTQLKERRQAIRDQFRQRIRDRLIERWRERRGAGQPTPTPSAK